MKTEVLNRAMVATAADKVSQLQLELARAKASGFKTWASDTVALLAEAQSELAYCKSLK